MSKQLNFAQQMDEVLKTLGPQRPKLLLHACCGPCSSAVLEKLCRYFEITVLYYNPNTWPAEEYYRRGEELTGLLEEGVLCPGLDVLYQTMDDLAIAAQKQSTLLCENFLRGMNEFKLKDLINAEAFAAVQSGTVKKGDVLGVARVAGIMATKRTSELIPLCHPLPLTKVSVDFRLLPERQAVEALCTVKTAGVTGVEMEALTGVSTALLTIYDMCKAVDKGMELGEIHLVEKTGGKSGHYIRAEGGYV